MASKNDNPRTNITIVDTNGKILKTGTQGLRVVSEDGIHLLDIGEVSDESVVNIFWKADNHFCFNLKMDERRSFNSKPDSAGMLPECFEFLIPRK